jgi:hypothetical protein
MARLIYSMITSLDGYAEAAEGDLGTGAEVEEVHTFIDDLFRPVRTYLYGRRMYETMVFWETAHADPDAPPHIVEYARGWQAAEKVVYSTTLESVSSERPGSSGPSTRTRCAGSRPKLITISASTARTSPPRRSRPAWSPSTTSSSRPVWSAAASGSFPTAYASISSWSRSVPSTAD